MMKPKGQTEHDEGMLEYLEDIIGSCRLKEPIQTLSRRIELLNEQRGEKVIYCYAWLVRNFNSCPDFVGRFYLVIFLISFLNQIFYLCTLHFSLLLDMSKMKMQFFFGFQLNRVKLVEKEKNALEGEKKKAVDFLTLENDIFRHKSRLCQYHVWVPQRLFGTWNNIISSCFCEEIVHSTEESLWLLSAIPGVLWQHYEVFQYLS